MRATLPVLASLLAVLPGCSSARPTADDPVPWPRPTVAPSPVRVLPVATPPRGALPGPVGVPSIDRYETHRAKAFAPRRFKALFRGDASPTVGAIVRGYLAVFWDGETLTWKTSAPVAGEGQSGHLTRSGRFDGERAPFPGRITAQDAIGALLGVLDLSPTGVGRSGEVTFEGGRSAELDASGRPVKISLPDGVSVKLEPGDGVPRRLEAKSPDGRATLVLESYGPWPEGE